MYPQLRELKIEVTNKCNLNCIHCSSYNDKEFEIDKKEMLRLMEECNKIRSLDTIIFSGGEPTFYPHLEDVFSSLKYKEKVLYTNGYNSDFYEILKSLKKMGLNKVIFSVYGPEHIHDQITKKDFSLEHLKESINICHNILELFFEIHFVPMSCNYKYLGDVCKMFPNTKISILRFIPHGRAFGMDKLALNKSQNLEFKKIINELKSSYNIRLGSHYNFLSINKSNICSAGINKLSITSDLNIYPCDAFKNSNYSSDNFKDVESLQEYFETSQNLKFLRDTKNMFGKECLNCKDISACKSGCPGQKYFKNKEFCCVDPDCLNFGD